MTAGWDEDGAGLIVGRTFPASPGKDEGTLSPMGDLTD